MTANFFCTAGRAWHELRHVKLIPRKARGTSLTATSVCPPSQAAATGHTAILPQTIWIFMHVHMASVPFDTLTLEGRVFSDR